MIAVLRSGSKGNASFLMKDEEILLIDFGITSKVFFDFIKNHDIDIKSKKVSIIITHVHSDHIKGLKTLKKKLAFKAYTEADNIPLLFEKMGIEALDIDNFNSKSFKLDYFPLSHDEANIGLIIDMGLEVVHITDTGYLKNSLYKKLTNKDVYILEFNHDTDMLLNGPYPLNIKQRIIGDYGHLSNDTSLGIINDLKGSKTKYLFMAHISSINNDRTLLENNYIPKITGLKTYLTYEDKYSEVIDD